MREVRRFDFDLARVISTRRSVTWSLLLLMALMQRTFRRGLVTDACVVRQPWTVRKDTGVRQPPPGTAATDYSAKYESIHLYCVEHATPTLGNAARCRV